MLRVSTKEKCIRILRNVNCLYKKIFKNDYAELIVVLQELQEAIIMVAEYLEKEIEESKEIISCLESLCELFDLLSCNVVNKNEYREKASILIEEILVTVNEIDVYYQVVFFPYKADMWDSLESIWLACKGDPKCDCKVVPIPYYSFDANKNEWIYHYEIDRFPSYVSVLNYKKYDLMECADAAFIHNPYDEYNYVTHVHSDYYSYNLKKYVKQLFYVPYFVTPGTISDNQKMLSVYYNADYFVVQSESFKDGLKNYRYGQKAIVMGSPKLDRVVRLSNNKAVIPKEWKMYIDGKKTIMLNTSLSRFLYDGEAYLRKIATIFEVIKQRDGIAVIWRPHPLLLSTIESMRPHLKEKYLQLQRFFIKERIGVLDTTSDIINTVAIADGYIGENGSSVINLFEAAGKPLFILNNYIRSSFSVKERQGVLMWDCEKVGDYYYLLSSDNGLLHIVKENDWENCVVFGNLEGGVKWIENSVKLIGKQKTLFFAPMWSEEFYSYDIIDNKMKKLSSIKDGRMRHYRFITSYKERIVYLPSVTKCIFEYDIETREWIEYTKPIRALQNGITERIHEDIYSYDVSGKFIWTTNLYSNRVLCFDMESGEYIIYEIGDVSARFSGIAIVENKLYLSNALSGSIYVWDINLDKQLSIIPMPSDYHMIKNVQGRDIAHQSLIYAEGNLFAIPFMSNGLIKIDLATEQATWVGKEFWFDVLEPCNYYEPQVHGVVSMAKLVDTDKLFVQKRRDASLLEFNVKTGKYKIHHPKLAPGELEKILENEDGFEKSYTNGEFARRESRYFSFEGFLDDLVNDRLEDAMARQKKEMETMAVNLDGTCGEKVHEFMMEVLQKDNL